MEEPLYRYQDDYASLGAVSWRCGFSMTQLIELLAPLCGRSKDQHAGSGAMQSGRNNTEDGKVSMRDPLRAREL